MEAESGTTAIKFIVLFIATVSCLGLFITSEFFQSPALLSKEVVKSVSTSSSTKPNIVFVIADDLGWGSLGYTDSDIDFATPYLTAMANDGIIISNYYAQEVCTPSRASMLTGRYPLSIGMQYGVVEGATAWGLPLEETTLAQVLYDNDYETHAIGKWHLGHFSPEYLPTARGFETFTGYLNGENYYYSKKFPENAEFQDFLTSDKDCYYGYEGSDKHNYSTVLYRDLAIDAIKNRDTDKSLFLYLAFQAVHDPFVDLKHFSNGVPTELLGPGIFHKIETDVVGTKRQDYAMALNVLDSSVQDIVNTLTDEGIMDNTYLIFASDNGGCYLGGGKAAPLRGTKGSLFEGGVKVDAFIYSPSLITSDNHYFQSSYPHLMHVSDWFPTLLDMASIAYSASADYALDGVSHCGNLLSTHAGDDDNDDSPREYLLYNSYYNVKDMTFSDVADAPFAIRNTQYKLVHTYFVAAYSSWYNFTETLDDDNALALIADCMQQYYADSDMEYALYDLINDPYETTNLYDLCDDDSTYAAAKEALLAQLTVYGDNSATDIGQAMGVNDAAEVVWKDGGNYVIPFVASSSEDDSSAYPAYCGNTDDYSVGM